MSSFDKTYTKYLAITWKSHRRRKLSVVFQPDASGDYPESLVQETKQGNDGLACTRQEPYSFVHVLFYSSRQDCYQLL